MRTGERLTMTLLRTEGLDSKAAGKQRAGDGTAGCVGTRHPFLTSHLALESSGAGLPPQLFLVLQINCFRLSCLLLPQPSSCCNTSPAGQ